MTLAIAQHVISFNGIVSHFSFARIRLGKIYLQAVAKLNSVHAGRCDFPHGFRHRF
jgi:hypothetical protein